MMYTYVLKFNSGKLPLLNLPEFFLFKGQLISETLFHGIKSPKNQTEIVASKMSQKKIEAHYSTD